MTYIKNAIDYLFGCHHGNLSRVFTISGQSYRICWHCGTKFEYSLDTMSLTRRESEPQVAELCRAAR